MINVKRFIGKWSNPSPLMYPTHKMRWHHQWLSHQYHPWATNQSAPPITNWSVIIRQKWNFNTWDHHCPVIIRSRLSSISTNLDSLSSSLAFLLIIWCLVKKTDYLFLPCYYKSTYQVTIEYKNRGDSNSVSFY